jgi:hypothetical protein
MQIGTRPTSDLITKLQLYAQPQVELEPELAGRFQFQLAKMRNNKTHCLLSMLLLLLIVVVFLQHIHARAHTHTHAHTHTQHTAHSTQHTAHSTQHTADKNKKAC